MFFLFHLKKAVNICLCFRWRQRGEQDPLRWQRGGAAPGQESRGAEGRWRKWTWGPQRVPEQLQGGLVRDQGAGGGGDRSGDPQGGFHRVHGPLVLGEAFAAPLRAAPGGYGQVARKGKKV